MGMRVPRRLRGQRRSRIAGGPVHILARAPIRSRESGPVQPMPTRSRTTAHALGLAAACFAVTATPAAAQTGGTSPGASAASRALTPSPVKRSYGGSAPRIASVRCERGCGAAAAARPSALVRVVGRGLRRTDEVVFLGADADGADDASVAPVQARRGSVLARVPRTAVGGRVTVVRPDGTRAASTAAPLMIDAAVTTVPPGEIDAEAQEHKVFFDDQRPAELSYVLGGAQPADVVVQLVRVADGAAVAQWTPGVVPAGVPQTVHWNGMSGGKVERDGVFQFRVSAVDAAPTRPTPSSSAASASRSRARTGTAPAPRRSAAGAVTRGTTPSRPAGRRWWPRAA